MDSETGEISIPSEIDIKTEPFEQPEIPTGMNESYRKYCQWIVGTYRLCYNVMSFMSSFYIISKSCITYILSHDHK